MAQESQYYELSDLPMRVVDDEIPQRVEVVVVLVDEPCEGKVSGCTGKVATCPDDYAFCQLRPS